MCPACDQIVDGIETRHFSTGEAATWLARRGKGHILREELAPMCSSCFDSITALEVKKRSEKIQAEARQKAHQNIERIKQDRKMAEEELHGKLGTERAYWDGVREHQDDLDAATGGGKGDDDEEDEWLMGNGIFGGVHD